MVVEPNACFSVTGNVPLAEVVAGSSELSSPQPVISAPTRSSGAKARSARRGVVLGMPNAYPAAATASVRDRITRLG